MKIIWVAVLFLVGCGSAAKRNPDGTFAEVTSVDPKLVEAGLSNDDNPGEDLDSPEKATIPKEINQLVVKWVNYFSGRGRKHMVKYLERSTRYTPMMKEILKKEGLPPDLIYLALIESGFSSSARSHASAVGYWQFIKGTGRLYGLQVSPLVDERRDFIRSTEAAAGYLKSLYNLFGSWYLAIASYNVGENRVKRVVMQRKTRDFWQLIRNRGLPRETVDYVPKFLAARMIAQHPERFGFTDLNLAPPLAFDIVNADRPLSLKLISENTGIDYEELKELNPAYKTEFMPLSRDGKLTLRVPIGQKDATVAVLEKSQVQEGRRFIAQAETEERYRKHKVRSGDTLGAIARRYGVTLASIKDANDLSRRGLVRAGQILKIPQSTRRPSRRAEQTKTKRSVYVARSGSRA